MQKKEKIDVYFRMNNRYYLLFSVIQMKGNGVVDLKITDFYNGFVIETPDKSHEDGCLTEQEMDKANFIYNAEISYHADGSFLRKNKDYSTPKYYNPYGEGVRWTPTDSIADFQPIMNIAIRRMEIYNKSISIIPEDTAKRKSHICLCDELFDLKGSYYLVLFIRNKSLPFCLCGNSQNYSNKIAELNNELDLCIFIQRHSFPHPSPYYSKYFKGWITPYAQNSINFCNKDSAKDEMMDKLGKTMFDPQFYAFLQMLNDGEYYYFSENKLKVIDEIDQFFHGFENRRSLPKPLFIRVVFQLLGKEIDSFNALVATEKALLLSQIDTHIKQIIKNSNNKEFK